VIILTHLSLGTVQSFADITQVLFGMIAVNDLGGIWELIVGNVPNPQGPIPAPPYEALGRSGGRELLSRRARRRENVPQRYPVYKHSPWPLNR
jgi:hypothetical protein